MSEVCENIFADASRIEEDKDLTPDHFKSEVTAKLPPTYTQLVNTVLPTYLLIYCFVKPGKRAQRFSKKKGEVIGFFPDFFRYPHSQAQEIKPRTRLPQISIGVGTWLCLMMLAR